MIAPMPNSGQKVCSDHIVEKSPRVQPTRHRDVLMAALRQVDLHVQKPSEVAGTRRGGGFCGAAMETSVRLGGFLALQAYQRGWMGWSRCSVRNSAVRALD